MKHFLPLILFLICMSCAKKVDVIKNQAFNHHLTSSTKSLLSENDNNSIITYDTLRNGIILEKRDGIFYLDDMMFNDSTAAILAQYPSSRDTSTRTGVTNNPSLYWRGRVVYYAFDSSACSSFRTTALEAMNELSYYTGVSFIEHSPNSGNPNYILFVQHSSANNSYVGMIGGAQVINICNYTYRYVILHEIFHALGYFHEHQRSDRDNYISIMTSNIKPDKLHNFQIVSSSESYIIGDFNFNSIMLYGSYTSDTSFVYNTSLPMMLKLDGTPFYQNLTFLSTGDINSIRAVYGPPYHRLEEVVTVSADYVYGDTEMYDAYHETYVKFYEDEECTIRSASIMPRRLYIHFNQTSNTSGVLVHNEGTTTIVVPPGIDSVFIDSRRNLEYYLDGSVIDIDTKYYTLQNGHVPDMTEFN